MPDAYGGFGGIAQYNRDLLDALSGSTHIESIVSLTRRPPANRLSLPEKLIEQTFSGNPARYVTATVNCLRRVRPDVILCGHINLLPVAALLKRLSKCSLILEAYGIEVWQKGSRFSARAIEQVDLVLAISRYTREKLIAWSGLKPEKVKVLPNAIHLRHFSMNEINEKPLDLIRRYGLQGKRVLLTLGRLASGEKYKGHDRIIDVMPELAKRFPDLIYLIAGDGDDRERLMALAKSSSVAERIVFAGEVTEAEKKNFYRVADAFAMPSTGEGFGFVFLEAAAMGLPVLGGNTDGSRDALLDGRLGTLVNPENRDELIDGLTEILGKKRAIPAAIEVFDFPQFKTQLEKLMVNCFCGLNERLAIH